MSVPRSCGRAPGARVSAVHRGQPPGEERGGGDDERDTTEAPHDCARDLLVPHCSAVTPVRRVPGGCGERHQHAERGRGQRREEHAQDTEAAPFAPARADHHPPEQRRRRDERDVLEDVDTVVPHRGVVEDRQVPGRESEVRQCERERGPREPVAILLRSQDTAPHGLRGAAPARRQCVQADGQRRAGREERWHDGEEQDVLHHVRGQVRGHGRVERWFERDQEQSEGRRERECLQWRHDATRAGDPPQAGEPARVHEPADDNHDEEELLSHRYG